MSTPSPTPRPVRPKHRQRFKLTDLLVLAVLAAVIVGLVVTLIGRLSLRQEVAGASTVTDRVVRDIGASNATDAWRLGDHGFQAKNSPAALTALFDSIKQIAHGTPTTGRQIVANAHGSHTVYVIYKYGGKTPYYIRVSAEQTAGASGWRLSGISGDTVEGHLIVK